MPGSLHAKFDMTCAFLAALTKNNTRDINIRVGPSCLSMLYFVLKLVLLIINLQYIHRYRETIGILINILSTSRFIDL